MADTKPTPPEGFSLIYEGQPLPPFYAAEMVRQYKGKTIWVADQAGRTRCGMVTEVPNIREDAKDAPDPVRFEDEKPLYLRQIVCIAAYEPRFKR